MFDNLSMEIIYYSVIPVLVIALIALFALIYSKKKDKNQYKYSYIVKISSIIMISLVLPLIIGYTIWLTGRYINRGTLSSNLGFIIILAILSILLIILLVILCRRLYKSLNK